MKVLVTGGAGFIGSHLVDALIKQGCQAVVVDNLSTGRSENVNPAAAFYQVDIGSPELETIFEREKPEIVGHQAAQTVIQKSMEDPVFDARQNILGSLNLISQCLRSGVKRVVYASSAGVYGEPRHRPVDESHPVVPVSYYGISKHTVEHYLHLSHLQNSLSYAVLRYSNVYGPRQSPKGEAGVVAIFTCQMLQGERPTMFGKGDKTRDYVYVADVVTANLLAMEKSISGVFNIGTGVETSDQEMFDLLAELTGYKGNPHYAPVRKGEIYRICLDSGKAQKEIGWQPRFALREGLAETVNYYRSIFGK
ncbi:MAG: NAD-dependent epimerase/dehydratase family protein [Dehalococcoidia bacterium]|nr:NAD-dependent epimerase/dehydratase family protein [Dehalococcoidia bacterium]